jgi:hypothetical protein
MLLCCSAHQLPRNKRRHNFNAAKVQKKQQSAIFFRTKVRIELTEQYDFLQNDNSD